jgi:hypothetical protein
VAGAAEKELVGRSVQKEFEEGIFVGEVVECRLNQGEWLLGVTYSDGDKEEYDLKEIQELLTPVSGASASSTGGNYGGGSDEDGDDLDFGPVFVGGLGHGSEDGAFDVLNSFQCNDVVMGGGLCPEDEGLYEPFMFPSESDNDAPPAHNISSLSASSSSSSSSSAAFSTGGDSGGGAAPFSFGGVFGGGDPMQIVTGGMGGGDAVHWGYGQPGETVNFDFPPVAPLQHGSFEDRPE